MKIATLLALVILTTFPFARAEEPAKTAAKGHAPAQAQDADQENFSIVLAHISDTHWKGTFSATGRIGLAEVTCKGPIKVRFFPGNDTDMPDESPTVSYRHDADFNQNLNLICETLGKKFSVVDVGSCKDFPMKANVEHGQTVMVPFRTLIPRDGGNSAVVSSPACKNGVVSRQELQLKKVGLSPDRKSLSVEIDLNTPILKGNFTYDLVRCQAGDDCL